jgi:hypothetical protein
MAIARICTPDELHSAAWVLMGANYAGFNDVGWWFVEVANPLEERQERTTADRTLAHPCVACWVFLNWPDEIVREMESGCRDCGRVRGTFMSVIYMSRPLRLIEIGSRLFYLLQVDLRQGMNPVQAECRMLLEVLEDESVTVIHHHLAEFLQDAARKHVTSGFAVLDKWTSLSWNVGHPHLGAPP